MLTAWTRRYGSAIQSSFYEKDRAIRLSCAGTSDPFVIRSESLTNFPVPKIFGVVIWIAVAALGAGALAVLALSRGETISAAWIVVAGFCSYAVAYRFYARFIGHRIFG